MATLKQIRARIKAAKNIQQITKAMKLVAAARLKKATDRVLEARPYADKLREVMGSLSSAGELPSHPLMDKRVVNKVGLIVLTSDRGLAGAFNTSLIRKASDFVKDSGHEAVLYTVGKKGTTFFGKRNYNVAGLDDRSPARARGSKTPPRSRGGRARCTRAARSTRSTSATRSSSPRSGRSRRSSSFSPSRPRRVRRREPAPSFEFDPSAEELLGTLLPRYFLTLVWQAMLESTASEFGARMTSMTSATDNAGKMIGELTLKANRERQAAITKEILEVVGGAEALKD